MNIISRQSVQHIEDIEIPVIEITESWAAESVQTPKDCDDAFAYLMSACAQIEFQIDTELTKPKNFQDVNWLARANCALKYKKAALQIVNQRRSQINLAAKIAAHNTQNQKLLEFIRANVSDEQFMRWIRQCNALSSPGEDE